MTQLEFHSKIPGIIIDPAHGESFLYIRRDKTDDTIVVGYKNEAKINSFGAEGKTFQEIYDSLYPDLVKHGHIPLK